MIYMMIVPRRKNFDLFEDIFDDPFFTGFDHSNKIMKTDIRENKHGYELTVDLPGYNKEDVRLSIEEGYLTIDAKTSNKTEEKDDGGKIVRRERYSGECKRSFYIGENISEEDISAEFANGVLKIKVPKKEEHPELPQKKYIEIK